MKYCVTADYSREKTQEVLDMVNHNCDVSNLPRPRATVTKAISSNSYMIACLDKDFNILEAQLKYIFGIE